MNNPLFSCFAQKESKFLRLLSRHAAILEQATILLAKMLEVTDQQERMEYYRKIKEQELAGDKVSREIFNELGTAFITPFDREDIHQLTDYIDDVIDSVNSSAKRIAIFNPNQNLIDGVELVRIIRQDSISINKAIAELDMLKSNASNIKKFCEVLHLLENRADDVYEAAMMKLFEDEPNSIEVIKNKDILYELERTTDAAERVGKILKTLIVKYA